MTSDTVLNALNRSISARRLLEHPYYEAWQDGLLDLGDLAMYAEQYRHFERCLPEVLGSILEGLPQGVARDRVQENLNDERTRPRPHVEIFEGFARSVGARTDVEPTSATLGLVDLYVKAGSSDPVAALAVIAAYELQASEIAATKASSLRVHYALGAEATEFWDLHAFIEKAHACWTVEALMDLDCDPSDVEESARQSAESWWAFLDEREIARVG